MTRTVRTTAALIATIGVLANLAASAAIAAPAPGTLLSATPMDGAPAGAKAWRIRYVSRSDGGKAETDTGVVVAPAGTAPKAGRPVLAWAHGTWGVTERCAPSLSPEFFTATPGLAEALARGWTVVATDYPGLGTPQPHPYLVGASAAHAVLDSVRAARRMPQAGAGPAFAVWGVSQGGHAALFTGELAKSYAPELRLTGVAAAAPPTDLPANLDGGKDLRARAFLSAYAAYSWSRHFGAPLSTLGGSGTQNLIGRLAQTCLTRNTRPKLGALIGIMVLRRDLQGVDLGRVQPWAGIARANSTGARPPGAPVLIAQNPEDTLVNADITHAFARRLCAKGASVRYLVVSGAGHPTTAFDSAGTTLDWIGDRFASRPAPSDCATL